MTKKVKRYGFVDTEGEKIKLYFKTKSGKKVCFTATKVKAKIARK